MKIFKTLQLMALTLVIVLLSTLLLKGGLSAASEIDEKKVETIPTNDASEKPIARTSVNISSNGELVNLEQQEALYQSVKDKINIQKADAKSIFESSVTKIFGDSFIITNNDLFLMQYYETEQGELDWSLVIKDDENKLYYWFLLNAMTGECTKMMKIDYDGFENPEDGALISGTATAPCEKQVTFYKEIIKDIIVQNNILNGKDNQIKDITLGDSLSIGNNRPIANIIVIMDSGKTATFGFYTDTDELVSIDIAE